IDEEVAAILEETRQAIIHQILFRGLGLDSARPAFRLAARSWIGAVEAACLDWLSQRDIERAELLSMLSQMLIAAMGIARTMDPAARIAWSDSGAGQ
ncbi:MAG: hypothetical protein AAF449_19350, partial [Myxococcota bacterium]